MPYADNQGFHIHYEVEGEGPSLVVHHGFGAWLETWYDLGYVDALKDNYRLVLLDARGHGTSDKPHDREAYTLALRVADVVAVLDDLDLSQAHYLGYSMGGYIGWGIAKYASERFLSLIIGGSGPLEETWDETESGPGPMQKLLRQGLDTWVTSLEEAFGRWWQSKWRARLLANDIEALLAMASRREGVGYHDVLSTMTVPCLIFVGEKDDDYPRAQQAGQILPNATFVCLAGLDHIEACCRTDLVLPHVRRFLAEVSEE